MCERALFLCPPAEFFITIKKIFFPFSATKYNSQQILDIVFILRVLRLIRIVDSIQR